MKVYRFGHQVGKKVYLYNSNFIMSRIAKIESETVIGCMYLEENGVIGYHKTVVLQLLLIVQGEGWVSGSEKMKVKVKAGDAVFWDKGEGHETWTSTSLTGIVIEAETILPQQFMPLQEVNINDLV